MFMLQTQKAQSLFKGFSDFDENIDRDELIFNLSIFAFEARSTRFYSLNERVTLNFRFLLEQQIDHKCRALKGFSINKKTNNTKSRKSRKSRSEGAQEGIEQFQVVL